MSSTVNGLLVMPIVLSRGMDYLTNKSGVGFFWFVASFFLNFAEEAASSKLLFCRGRWHELWLV